MDRTTLEVCVILYIIIYAFSFLWVIPSYLFGYLYYLIDGIFKFDSNFFEPLNLIIIAPIITLMLKKKTRNMKKLLLEDILIATFSFPALYLFIDFITPKNLQISQNVGFLIAAFSAAIIVHINNQLKFKNDQNNTPN